MGYLYIFILKALQQAEGMLTRRYSKRHGDGGMLFNAIVCLFSMFFFLITDKGGLFFPRGILLYGILSAFMFATGFYSFYRALQYGSYVLSVMMTDLSTVVVLLYALLYLKEDPSPPRYLAIVLSIACAVVINLGKKEGNRSAFSFKWFFWALLSLLSNGAIGILNRQQQITFNAAYDNEFMIVSLAGSSIALAVLALLFERDKWRSIMGSGFVYGATIGLINGSRNFVQLLAFLYLPLTVLSPVSTGVGLVMSFAISLLVYKEKLTKYQLIGTLLGVVALMLIAIK